MLIDYDYYYAGIFDAGLVSGSKLSQWNKQQKIRYGAKDKY